MSDKRDELIVEQALKLHNLEKQNAIFKKNLKEIYCLLISCGGPLNDNYDQYNKQQLEIFGKIYYLSKDYEEEDE